MAEKWLVAEAASDRLVEAHREAALASVLGHLTAVGESI
jgi:hypothetical protein